MPGLHLITFNSNDEMMYAIQRNEVLVFAADTLTDLHYLQKYDLRTQFEFKPNAPIYSNAFFPAVKQGNIKLLKIITAGMKQITSSESRQIAREWASGQKKSDKDTLIFSILKGDVAGILHETMTLEADLNRMGLSGRLKKGSKSVMNNAIHAGVAKQNKKLIDLINTGYAAISPKKLATIESRWIPRSENRFYSTGTKDIIFSEEEKLFLANHSPLTFSEVNWKPMSIVYGTNQFDGIIADYFNQITQRSGLRFKFIKSDTWDQVRRQYVDKAIDVVPALGKDDKIDRPILFSKPFARFSFVIVTLDNVAHISDVSHLKNRKVAVGKGYTSYHYLKNNYPGIELVQTDNVKSGLLLVANRKVTAFVGHMAVVTNCIQENGLINLKIAGETEYTIDHCIGVTSEPGKGSTFRFTAKFGRTG